MAGRLLQHRHRSYDFPTAHLSVDGIYTNKAPGGVAYRCRPRDEAAYCIERGMDILAQKLRMDPAELRLKNFISRSSFRITPALGWESIRRLPQPP